jgi:hypothetical protein
VATATATKNQVPCLICGAWNRAQQTQCTDCSAPLSLVHEALTQKRDPRIVSIVGDSNVGKTVYLGFLLDMLSQHGEQFEAIPRGPCSVDLPQLVISHLAHRMFPPKTPMESNQWNWTYYQVRKQQRRGKWVDLVMPDMAGEALAAEVAAPSTFRVIEHLLARSAGVMLLVDGALAGSGSAQPDFFAVKMLSVLTKADYVPESFDRPRQFAQANLNRLWQMVEHRFERVEFFASSVVGSLGYATTEEEQYVTPIPLHTAVRGILEPFAWILDQM